MSVTIVTTLMLLGCLFVGRWSGSLSVDGAVALIGFAGLTFVVGNGLDDVDRALRARR